jgi:hypothetical protein
MLRLDLRALKEGSGKAWYDAYWKLRVIHARS